MKTHASQSQKKKAGASITREDLVSRFHLPIQTVSAELGICTTMVQSLNNLITQLRTSLSKPTLAPEVRSQREEELAVAEAKMRIVLDDPNSNVSVAPQPNAASTLPEDLREGVALLGLRRSTLPYDDDDGEMEELEMERGSVLVSEAVQEDPDDTVPPPPPVEMPMMVLEGLAPSFHALSDQSMGK
eukprot:m51a1_g10553 hypothetical protein (187) ;mRNA; r:44861-45626